MKILKRLFKPYWDWRERVEDKRRISESAKTLSVWAKHNREMNPDNRFAKQLYEIRKMAANPKTPGEAIKAAKSEREWLEELINKQSE